MPTEAPPPILLMLHEGGWDEVLMVAVGLLAAYAVIMWTGRRSHDEEEDEDNDLDGEGTDGRSDVPAALHDDPPRPKV